MATTNATKRPSKADRAIRRLYTSVDRLIRAAEEAKSARDEIIRLGQAQQKQNGGATDAS